MTFLITLDAVQQLLPGPTEMAQAEHTRCVEALMSFLSSLEALDTQPQLEIRYQHQAALPGRIRIGLLIHDVDHDEALALFDLFRVLNPWYQMAFVHDQAAIEAYLPTIEPTDVVEVLRRDDRVPLRQPRKILSRVIGFGAVANKEVAELTANPSDSVYFVFPYLIDLDTRQRLAESMLVSRQDVVISVRLQASKLTPEESKFLQERTLSCERELASMQNHSDGGSSEVLAVQTRKLLDTCLAEFYQFLDALFCMQVLIASPTKVPAAVLAALGACRSSGRGIPTSDEG